MHPTTNKAALSARPCTTPHHPLPYHLVHPQQASKPASRSEPQQVTYWGPKKKKPSKTLEFAVLSQDTRKRGMVALGRSLPVSDACLWAIHTYIRVHTPTQTRLLDSHSKSLGTTPLLFWQLLTNPPSPVDEACDLPSWTPKEDSGQAHRHILHLP